MSNGTSSPADLVELLTISTPEAVFIGLETCVQILSLCFLAYVNYHRNYLPLKVLQIPFITVGVIGALIWWLGCLAVLRVFPQVHNPVFLVCTLWGIWVQLVFGLFVFVASLLLRFFRLIAIIKLRWNVTGWRTWLMYFVLWCPILIYGIITSALNINGPIVDGNGFEVCNFSTVGFYILMGFLGVYVVALLVGMIALRKVKQRFLREYKDSLWASLYFFVIYVVYLIIIAMDKQRLLWGRLLNSALVTSVPLVFLIITAGYPAYKCFTDHDAYETFFKNKLQDFSLESGKKNAVSASASASASAKTSLTHKSGELTNSPSLSQVHEMDILA